MPSFTPPITRRNRGKGHSYHDATGARVPGVTTVLNSGCPKPALINWAARTTVDYAIDYWDELNDLPISERIKRLNRARSDQNNAAKLRGTRVHTLGERVALGETVEVPDDLVDHVEAYAAFLDAWDVQPIVTEAVVVSYRHGYAGTLDLIADMRHPTEPGRRCTCLLDLKTSESGVFRESVLQLAAYRYATHYLDPDGVEHPMLPVDLCAVVHVRADGAHFVPVVVGDEQHRQFLYVQQVAQFVDTDANDLIGDPLSLPPMEVPA